MNYEVPSACISLSKHISEKPYARFLPIVLPQNGTKPQVMKINFDFSELYCFYCLAKMQDIRKLSDMLSFFESIHFVSYISTALHSQQSHETKIPISKF